MPQDMILYLKVLHAQRQRRCMWTLSGRHQAHPLKTRMHLRKAGDGLRNLKKRTGIHSVVRHGEATAPAEKFVPEFQELITSEGTYITAKEKSLPGHKPMNNRLTFMLYINSNGNYKIKPLLICHSENP